MTATREDELADRRTDQPDPTQRALKRLRDLPNRYTHLWALRLARHGQPTDPARTGKPRSTPPAGIQPNIHRALVDQARALIDAYRALTQLDGCPTTGWEPRRTTTNQHGQPRTIPAVGHSRPEPHITRRCQCRARWHDDPDRIQHADRCPRPLETIIPRIITVWHPYGDDLSLAPPLPRPYADACHRLAGLLGWAATRTDHTNPHLREAHRAIGRAWTVTRRKGMPWEPEPRWPAVCANCLTPKVYADDRCEPCYRYLRRTKRERPQHLWGAA